MINYKEVDGITTDATIPRKVYMCVPKTHGSI